MKIEWTLFWLEIHGAHTAPEGFQKIKVPTDRDLFVFSFLGKTEEEIKQAALAAGEDHEVAQEMAGYHHRQLARYFWVQTVKAARRGETGLVEYVDDPWVESYSYEPHVDLKKNRTKPAGYLDKEVEKRLRWGWPHVCTVFKEESRAFPGYYLLKGDEVHEVIFD